MSESDETLDNTSVKIEQKSSSVLETVKFILTEYKLAVYITLIAGIGFVGTNFTGFTVPPIVKFAFKAFLIGIIPLTLLGKVLIVDKYMSKRMKRILAYNPKDGLVPDIIFVPPPIWKNRKSNDLPVRKCNDADMIDYEVEFCEFDEDENQLYVGGINEEIANPVDIAIKNGRLKEVYNELLKDRQKLKRLEGTLKTKRFEMQENNFNAIIEAVEKGTTMDMEKTINMEMEDDFNEFTPNSENGEDISEKSENNSNGEGERKTLNELEEAFTQNGESNNE
jgi:hypothetical protein